MYKLILASAYAMFSCSLGQSKSHQYQSQWVKEIDPISLVFFLFVCWLVGLGRTHGMQKFSGQGLNLSRSRDKARSLTSYAIKDI